MPQFLATMLVAVALTAAATAAAAPSHAARTCPHASLHVVYKGHRRCLSLAARKRIFRNLLRYQNSHAGRAAETYAAISKRWRIPLVTVQTIMVEGAVKRWPIPATP